MRKLFVIGIGAGDPDFLTLQAIKAIAACDAFLIPDKGEDKSDLKAARLAVLDRHARSDCRLIEIAMPDRDRSPQDYRATVDAWHSGIVERYLSAIAALGSDDTIGLLVWGDPSLYDSTLRIVASMRANGAFDLEVVPGISAVQALCARHKIPLNAIGEAVVLTTGRKLGTRLPDNAATVVVMLDGEQAFTRLEDDVEIFWGAYLGTVDEILVAGRLVDVKDDILAKRAEARARKGWIMDTYLLRKLARSER